MGTSRRRQFWITSAGTESDYIGNDARLCEEDVRPHQRWWWGPYFVMSAIGSRSPSTVPNLSTVLWSHRSTCHGSEYDQRQRATFGGYGLMGSLVLLDSAGLYTLFCVVKVASFR